MRGDSDTGEDLERLQWETSGYHGLVLGIRLGSRISASTLAPCLWEDGRFSRIAAGLMSAYLQSPPCQSQDTSSTWGQFFN